MAGTYSKAVIDKNIAFLKRKYRSPRNFYNDVMEHIGHFTTYYSNGTKRVPSIYETIYRMAESGFGPFPAYTEDKEEYLARTIPDYDWSRTHKANGELKMNVVEQTYNGMMARDGTKLFERVEVEMFLDGKPVNFQKRR